MFRLRTLGGLWVEGPNGPLGGRAAGHRQLALLAVLATPTVGRLSRDKLVALLWPERSDQDARRLLSDTIYVVRREVDADPFAMWNDNVGIDRAVLQSDVGDFTEAVHRGDLPAAVDLYGGPFVEGFHLNGVTTFEDWALAERQRLADVLADVLERLARAAEATADPKAAVKWWSRLATHTPHHSRVAVALARSMANAGDVAGALRGLQQHATALKNDLGIAAPKEVTAWTSRLRHAASAGFAGSESRPSPFSAAREPRVDWKRSPSVGEAAKQRPVAVEGPGPTPSLPEARKPGDRRWHAPRAAIGALAAFLALGWGLRYRGTEPGAAGALVAPMVNATGIASLDPLGNTMARAVTDALHQAGMVRVVPSTVVEQTLADLEADGRTGTGVALAAARHHRTQWLVTGQIEGTAGELELRVEIVELGSEALAGTPGPIPIDADSLKRSERRVIDAVLGAFTGLTEERLIELGATFRHHTPTLAALRYFQEGMGLSGEKERAALRRAIDADPSFWGAYVWLAARSDPLTRDSLLAIVGEHVTELSTYDRLVFKSGLARVRGDRVGLLALRRRRFELAPASDRDRAEYGNALVSVGRYDSALTVLRSIDPTRGWWAREIGIPSNYLSDVEHLLGDYEAEHRTLEAVPDGARNREWTAWRLGRSAIALGDSARVDSLLNVIGRLPNPPAQWVAMAWEMKRHDQIDRAVALYQHILAWYDADSARVESPVQRCEGRFSYLRPHRYGAALLMAGRAHLAVPVLQACADASHELDPELPGRLGILGLALVEAGMLEQAGEVEARLLALESAYRARGWDPAIPLWHRMFLVAADGERRAEAMERLREFLEIGGAYGDWLHSDARLEPLRGEPDFASVVGTPRQSSVAKSHALRAGGEKPAERNQGFGRHGAQVATGAPLSIRLSKESPAPNGHGGFVY